MSDRSLKSRLRRGEIGTGTFLLFLAGGDVAQFLAGLGFDYFILDLEHSAFDLAELDARAAQIGRTQTAANDANLASGQSGAGANRIDARLAVHVLLAQNSL